MRRSTAHAVHFVGIDGEGVDRPDGSHDYNLLSIGSESLYHPDGRRLRFDEIAQFIWDYTEENPTAVLVGFFLGYDFAQWLADLPEERAKMLLTDAGQASRRRDRSGGNFVPFPVRFKRWEFDILGMRRLKLRLLGEKRWAYVMDAGSFFQTSLLNAINPKDWPEPICTPDEYQTIVEGKAARSGEAVPFGRGVDPETIKYNVLENDVLARLMDRINEGLTSAEVRLRRTQWHGPGQAAQAWLSATAPAHEGTAVRAAVPVEVIDAARRSYFGGWFEITCHGPVEAAWAVDINSAYPHVASTLPCLLHGSWRPHTEGEPGLTVALGTLRGSDPYLGAMLHRTPAGRVLRPASTRGWVWMHEVGAAMRAGLVDSIDIEEGWTYHPCDCPPPLRAVADLYQRRIEVGKGTPHGKAFKLVYNSLYGKLAQSIGQPRFANPIWASLITAGCRSMILDAIATHPDRSRGVAMIATDGITFLSPHPTLDYDDERLGAWDQTKLTGLSLFKPGMYWDDKAREAIQAGARKLGMKCRGVNEAALAEAIDSIDAQWAALSGNYPTSDEWPTVEIVTPFGVISPRLALHRGKWELAGSIVHDERSSQSANPRMKRQLRSPDVKPDSLIRTSPWLQLASLDSTPYDKHFGLELEAMSLHDIATLDATFMVELRELLNLA